MFFDDEDIAELVREEIRYGMSPFDPVDVDEIVLFVRVKNQWPGISRKRFRRILRRCIYNLHPRRCVDI